MTGNVNKYQTWRAFDESVAADAAESIHVFSSEVTEDLTIVGARAELVLMTDSDPAEGLGGYVALQVVPRSLNEEDTLGYATSTDWLGNSTSQCINDSEGDHWAISPFGVCGRHNDRVLLSPTTKRKLRKGEKLVLSVRVQNFTNAAQFLKICATITVFTLHE